MELFKDNNVNISKLYTVNMYEEKNEQDVHYYEINQPTYELIFYCCGKDITYFGNSVITDEPYSIRYLPKGATVGEYKVVPVEQPSCCIDIYFDTMDPMPDYAIGIKNMHELKLLFEKIYYTWHLKKPGYYEESLSILYEIIKIIKLHNSNYISSDQSEKIFPSYEYMLKNCYDHNFSYKEMCLRSGLSYNYFKELFKKQYGISPVKYVTKLRLDYSKELMMTGRYSVTEIASMCGFENVYYFSKVFKKHIGISPKKYESFNEKKASLVNS